MLARTHPKGCAEFGQGRSKASRSRAQGLDMAPFPPALPGTFVQVAAHLVCLVGSLLSGLSTGHVSPSVWSVIHDHAGSPEATDGQPAWLGWVAWVLTPALSPGDPEINFPKYQVVFHNTLESVLLLSKVHMKTEQERSLLKKYSSQMVYGTYEIPAVCVAVFDILEEGKATAVF